MSATHRRFGAGATKRRSTRSAGRSKSWPLSVVAVHVRPRRAPERPISRISHSMVQRATVTPLGVELRPDLRRAVDEEVLVVDPADLDFELSVTGRPSGRLAATRRPVGVRSDPHAMLPQHAADRLDPEAVPVGVDERHYFFDWRSSSAPKKDAAALRISFARRS